VSVSDVVGFICLELPLAVAQNCPADDLTVASAQMALRAASSALELYKNLISEMEIRFY